MKKKKLTGKEKRAARREHPTIEELENDYWGNNPDYPSHLVETIYKLRKKKLNEFTTEDLRITIGQNLSLPLLIPLAIDTLSNNILAEGDFYEGNLLKNVLHVKPEFWNKNPELKLKFIEVFEQNYIDY